MFLIRFVLVLLVQKVIGPIRISHLYRSFFFFIFSWPYYVLSMPKFKP